MTVAWGRLALEDRTRQLIAAFERAVVLPDPYLFAAALARDDAIETEAG
ncbi:MAG TPA: plasmid stabilization protein, partial [Stenotrophomonas sp.]|nr:plasmid stabilization protein [Stenotrophomonas sp.]